jgi:hypothetical protein
VEAKFFISRLGEDVDDHLQNVIRETIQVVGLVHDVAGDALDVFSWVGFFAFSRRERMESD